MFPSSIHVIHVIPNEELRWCQKLHKYMCLCMSSDPKLDAQRQRLSSVVAADLLPSLEGVELGAIGKTVSYAQFLYPTNALVRQKSSTVLDSSTVQTPQCRFRANGQKGFTPARPNSGTAQDSCMNTYIEEVADYDPNLLSDPCWPCGRHKRVLIFASYVVSRAHRNDPGHLLLDYYFKQYPFIWY
uniref:Uncharacterized protein n=1 Tax=Cyprinodon variegatus TaxID=28743 RepID=A0A3Q2EG63_CYPVA